MDTLEVYKYSVMLAGIVTFVTALVMTAAGWSRFVDTAFTIREWFYSSIFFSTWLVIERSGIRPQQPETQEAIMVRNYFMYGLIIISLLCLSSIVMSRWKYLRSFVVCLFRGKHSDSCRVYHEKEQE